MCSPDGHRFAAYEAGPPKPETPRSGVVIIQEIFGVNEHIRMVTDSYAELGYLAIAPAIFDRVERGVELGYGEADMSTGMNLAFEQLAIEDALTDVQTAITHLADSVTTGKVGVIGFCFGGLLSWLAACDLSGLNCAVSYYGGGVVDMLDKRAKCPVVMHFGGSDPHIPMSGITAFGKAQPMDNLDIYVYEAGHGFNCDARDSYDEESATHARGITVQLLRKHLFRGNPRT